MVNWVIPLIIPVSITATATLVAAIIAKCGCCERRRNNGSNISGQSTTASELPRVNQEITSSRMPTTLTATELPRESDAATTSQSTEVVSKYKLGPWGDTSIGHPFDQHCNGQLRIITISSGSVIDSVKVQYEMDGNLIWTPQAGGSGGNVGKIVLENGEYIIEVKGEYKQYRRITTVINSLTFTTNKGRKFGPYGMPDKPQHEVWENWTAFHVRGGRIVGFHGTANKYINSIGFYLSTTETTLPSLPSNQGEI